MTVSSLPVPPTPPVASLPTKDIKVSDIIVIPEAQRDLDTKRVRVMVDNWRPELVGTLAVSDRGNGKYACLDGQHRHRAAGILGIGILPCVVHTGLTLKDEAKLFLAFQRERKTVSPISTYKVSITAGEAWAIDLQRVTKDLVLEISGTSSVTRISAIRSCQKIHELGGEPLLRRTLMVIQNAYGMTAGRDTWSGDILFGVAKVIARNPKIDDKRLSKVLQSQAPKVWAADVATLSKGSGGSAGRPAHLATHLARVYNKGLRTVSHKIV